MPPMKVPHTPSQITHVDTLLKGRRKKGFKDFDSIFDIAKKMKPIRRL